MKIINIKSSVKHCAFCKYWYDPAQTHINPKSPTIGIWEYDDSAQCKCTKRNLTMPAYGFCTHYTCKI